MSGCALKTGDEIYEAMSVLSAVRRRRHRAGLVPAAFGRRLQNTLKILSFDIGPPLNFRLVDGIFKHVADLIIRILFASFWPLPPSKCLIYCISTARSHH